MLNVIAITTARTEAITEVAPLIPQNHGVSVGDLVDAIFMPSGKAIPIKTEVRHGRSTLLFEEMG